MFSLEISLLGTSLPVDMCPEISKPKSLTVKGLMDGFLDTTFQ